MYIPYEGFLVLVAIICVSGLVYKKFGEIYALITLFVLIFAVPLAIRYITLGY